MRCGGDVGFRPCRWIRLSWVFRLRDACILTKERVSTCVFRVFHHFPSILLSPPTKALYRSDTTDSLIMPAKPLGSVIRHMTTPPTPSSLSQFAPPKTCLLQPKKALQDGRVPGMFHNLFVTNRQPPSIDQEDQSESEVGKKCLVAPGGVNFR